MATQPRSLRLYAPSLGVPPTTITLSEDLLATCLMAQKAKAFDIIVEQRAQLADVNREIQKLQKLSERKQGAVHAQLLGKKAQIEKTIQDIFESFSEAK